MKQKKMKQATVGVPFDIRIEEVDVPVPGNDEVLVRVTDCAICGTDVHDAKHRAIQRRLFGHEMTGEVVQAAPGVSGFAPGDIVAVGNAANCGFCRQCRNGRAVYCCNRIGLPAQGFSEYAAPNKALLHKTEGLCALEASLAEPLTVALDMVNAAQIPLNGTAAIIGPGPIGLMAVKLVKQKGAGKIYLAGLARDEARLNLGIQLGADEILIADKDDIVEQINTSEPEGLDRILITAPPSTIPSAIKMSRYGGIITYVGFDFGQGRFISFDADEFHVKKLQLRASFAVPNMMFPLALDLIRKKVIDADKFITHTFTLEQLPDALQTVANGTDGVIKAVVRMK